MEAYGYTGTPKRGVEQFGARCVEKNSPEVGRERGPALGASLCVQWPLRVESGQESIVIGVPFAVLVNERAIA